MANMVLPLRIGEFVRPYLASRGTGVALSTMLATAVVERVLDLLALVAMGLWVLTNAQVPDVVRQLTQLAAVLMVIAISGILVVHWQRDRVLPVLDKLWRDRDWRAEHGDDLMIVGVSVDTDPPARVAEWIADRGFEYPIVIGDQDLAMRYGVLGFPTLILIDPTGGIHTRHMGVWSRPEIEDALDRIRRESSARG